MLWMVDCVVCVFMFVFGAIMGSFLNVCICRLPKKESILRPGSRCPNCKTHLKWWENIPILSFLLLKARCRYCKCPISLLYPLVEIITAILYLTVFLKFGISTTGFVFLVFSSILVVIAFIDLKHQLILNKLSYPGIVFGFLMSPFFSSLREAALGFFVGGGILYLLFVISPYIFHREGVGLGDVKLSAMLGVYLGWQATFLALIIASMLGSLVGICLLLAKLKKRGDYLAFGPYLCSGALISLFFGEEIINTYLSFMRI